MSRRFRVAAGLLAGWSLLIGCARREAEDAAREVAVAASIEPATATVGDRLRYRLRIEHAPEVEIEELEPEAEIGGLRIVDSGAEPARRLSWLSSRRVDERWWDLTADEVGSYELPGFEVGYRRLSVGAAEAATATSEAVTVEIESVLPADGSAGDIRDIKPPRARPSAFPWWWVAAGVAAVALIAWLIHRRRRRGAADRPSLPLVPPHVAAYRALDDLKGRELPDAEAVRRYYFELSGTLRTYVEGRFGLNATDLTSEEILAALVSSRSPLRSKLRNLGREPQRLELGPEADALLRRFLDETDRVKYADQHVERREIESSWAHARRFVEVTEPLPPAEGEREGSERDGEQAA